MPFLFCKFPANCLVQRSFKNKEQPNKGSGEEMVIALQEGAKTFRRHLADCSPHCCFYLFVQVQSAPSSCSHVTFLLGREPLSFSNAYLGFTTGPGTERAASKVVCGIDE